MAVNVNRHFRELGGSYLFSEVARKVAAFQKENPDRSIIRMGIGDVTRPIPPVIVEAMKKAAEEMGTQEGFHGYGPEQGYGFLREAVAGYYSKEAWSSPRRRSLFPTAQRAIWEIWGIFLMRSALSW